MSNDEDRREPHDIGRIAYEAAAAETGCAQPWEQANQAKWSAAARGVLAYTDHQMKLAYKEGHRDARHAAAEIAIQGDAEVKALRDIVAELKAEVHALKENRKAIAAVQALRPAFERLDAQQEGDCSTHPDAPHGFNRSASHNSHKYVCDCEGWEPPNAALTGAAKEK